MKITSVRDELELSGDNVIIRKRGVGNAMASGLNGERSIAICTITAVQLKTAGWLPGYILFSYAGSKPFRGGLIEATQDPDAFVFEKARNEEIIEFKKRVDEIMLSLKAKPSEKAAANNLADELMKLATMRESGILSQVECEAAKKKLLD
ncbi:MAG: DUF4429 domain-containing protein [Stellaceae bacterium]